MPAEFIEQREQVHGEGNDYVRRGPEAEERLGLADIQYSGHRNWDDAGADGEVVSSVHAGGRFDFAKIWRDRFRPGVDETILSDNGRGCEGGERAGKGFDVYNRVAGSGGEIGGNGARGAGTTRDGSARW